ncbi:MAG: DUF1828 domain-containing protein [Anaerolineae bacterium]
MNCEQWKEKVLSSLPILFVCQEEKRGLRISTPYLYPNGDYIDLYLVETPTGLYLTDLGETMGYLADCGISPEQSPKRLKVINDILLTQGIERFRGELRVPIEDEKKITWSVTRLSQAIVQISDLIYSLRLSALISFKEEVEEYLIEKDIPYETNYLAIGGSGEYFTVDFHIPVPKRSWMMETLSSQSQTGANLVVSKVIRMWHDLRRVNGRYGYISLIDDSAEVWKTEWFDQLADFSEVITWSEREKLLRVLELPVSRL